MEIARKVVNGYNAIEKISLIVMMAIMVVFIFAQVFTRYILGNALYWSEELGRFVFVWVSWLGVSAGLNSKEHIQVKLLPNAFHVKGFLKTEKVIYIIIDLLWFITSALILIHGADIVKGQIATGVYGPSTEIPMWIAYLCIPFSAAIICLRLIGQMVINSGDLIDMFRGKIMEEVK